MEMKTVSVVMATYNGEKYLSEQIDSILAQSYPVHELIIQDDCSADGTTGIVRQYMEKYPFIKLFINEQNVGYNENFRLAAMHATGDFVALSDQDDIWFPQKLERQVAAIGDADICFSNTLDGKTLESSKPFPDRRYTLETTIWRNQVSGHTMLCRREFVQNPTHWLGYVYYDWSLTLHALINGSVVKVDEPLNFHRRLPTSVTNTPLPTLTWQPYLYGWGAYRCWQNHPPYRRLYTYLYNMTHNTPHRTVNSMCRLILRRNIFSLLRLCLLCMKHRNETYLTLPSKDLKGILRSFFLPHICSYTWVEMEKLKKQRKGYLLTASQYNNSR
jgi:glycosyltransferase involved in cell wall biosynthesis